MLYLILIDVFQNKTNLKLTLIKMTDLKTEKLYCTHLKLLYFNLKKKLICISICKYVKNTIQLIYIQINYTIIRLHI